MGNRPVCTVETMMRYLSVRGDGHSPLILLQDGHPLSLSLLTDWLRQIMSAAGIHGNFSSRNSALWLLRLRLIIGFLITSSRPCAVGPVALSAAHSNTFRPFGLSFFHPVLTHLTVFYLLALVLARKEAAIYIAGGTSNQP